MSVVLSEHLPLLASAPDGIQKLRGLILELAVRGKLVPQNPNDEPASELLKQIAKERVQQESNGTGKKSKPTPPVSKDEQAFELPDGWAWVRFADVTSYIQRGKGPDYADKSDYVVVSQKCVRWHGLDLSQARWITPESFSKYDTIRLLRGGDVLWNSTGTGTIGRAIVVPSLEAGQVLVADSHVTVVRSVLMSPIYLWRWIQSPSVQHEIEGSASGSTNQIELATSTVTAHPLPLPPLAEQHRIVAKVDELMALCDRLEAEQADAASAHARLVETLLGTLTQSTDAADLAANWQRLAEYFDTLFTTEASIDALKQTVLQLAVMGKLVPQDPSDEPASKIFAPDKRLESLLPHEIPRGWTLTGLSNLAEINGGFAFKSTDYTDNGMRVVRISDFDELGFKNHKVVRHPFSQELSRFSLAEDNILMAMTGGTVGKSYLVKVLPEPMIVNQRVATIKVLEGACPTYVDIVIRAEGVQAAIRKAKNSTNDNISMSDIKGFAIPLPPIAEQRRIVAKVDELMALCDNLKADIVTACQHQTTLTDTLIESALEAV